LNNSQTVTDAYSYEAYGKTTHGTGSNGNSQQFTGRENDGAGLFFYRARYYKSEVGRFISADSIGWASGQTNDYGYVFGDPISNIDPSGHGILVIFTVGAVCVGAYVLISNAIDAAKAQEEANNKISQCLATNDKQACGDAAAARSSSIGSTGKAVQGGQTIVNGVNRARGPF
jgi:RHS repeat-associated protein